MRHVFATKMVLKPCVPVDKKSQPYRDNSNPSQIEWFSIIARLLKFNVIMAYLRVLGYVDHGCLETLQGYPSANIFSRVIHSFAVWCAQLKRQKSTASSQ